MSIRLKLELGGKHSVFLSSSQRYINGLEELPMFRDVPEKVPALPHLKEGLEQYRRPYEASLNGDRVQAAMRDQARKKLTEMFKKVLHYLQSIAEEEDIPALLQAGFEVVRPTIRKRASVVPAS